VSTEHFDLEAAIEFANVADFDAVPEHRLAVAFDSSLCGSHVQEIDKILVGCVGLQGENQGHCAVDKQCPCSRCVPSSCGSLAAKNGEER
jgi:hypothetical protein